MTTPVFHVGGLLRLPHPRSIYRRIGALSWSSKGERDQVLRVLDEYGLRPRARIEILRGRSDSFILKTAAGKKLLKRYKISLDQRAMQYEHAILRYLAQIHFPAPRLTPTINGETLVWSDGRAHALYDFAEGYFSYHDYLFAPAHMRRFIEASAKALGCLHNALRSFNTEGCNAGGHKSTEGDGGPGLSWLIDELNRCRREVASLGPEVDGALSHMVRQKAMEVEDRLRHLNDLLAAASLPRTTIHGDYGPYNLLFKRGSPVVIIDFELARLDWRLTDLAKALPAFAISRLGFSPSKAKCFLVAYQTCCPIDREELRLLPALWQFLTLRRVIRSWSRYCDTRDNHWLAEAQRKLSLARWIADNENRLSALCNRIKR